MKKNRRVTALLGQQRETCAVCTTPTRCGAPRLGDKGPRCVGRSDGPDNCDCINSCGDDPWIKDGRSSPCPWQREILQSEAMDGFNCGATWTYAVPPLHDRRVMLVHVVWGGMPEPRRDSPLHNGFYVWVESWSSDWCRWHLVKGSISNHFHTREAAHLHASQVWAKELQA